MRDNDELTNIPPIVPSRDDVDTHHRVRKQQAKEIVRPGYYTEKVKVSTWPVRIMITLLTIGMLGGAGAAYYFYDLYQNDLRTSELRLGDLERKLALVGDSSEETALNIQETLDFHFSEIDKLWAARNRTNESVEDTKSELAKLVLVNQGQDEAAAALSQQVAGTGEQLNAANTRLNTLATEFEQLNRSVATLNESVGDLMTLRDELQVIRTALNSGDSTLLGLVGRLDYLEQSMESVNAHRLQINESLFRLQQNIEAVQRAQQPSGTP